MQTDYIQVLGLYKWIWQLPCAHILNVRSTELEQKQKYKIRCAHTTESHVPPAYQPKNSAYSKHPQHVVPLQNLTKDSSR